MPIEYFPPAVNMVKYFSGKNEWAVSVCTNWNHLGREDFSDSLVEMVRGTFPTGRSGLNRIFAYLSFHLKSFFHILKNKPDFILYIEPHSAFPVFLSRLVFRRALIFIHYHEYHSPEEFLKPGMRMAKWFHGIEKKWLYPTASWISQTNGDRLRMFLQDNPGVDVDKATVLPNYPSASWWSGKNKAWEGNNVAEFTRLVYVGALSRVDTFIEEIVNWVKSKTPRFTLDIYCYNLHPETRSYLRQATDGQVRFHEQGIPYEDLPGLLRTFHAGLILYKGNTPNYVHNASNKLFEYLACGLDVIYPNQMEGVKPFRTGTSRPRVIECDFENLSSFSYTVQNRQMLPPVSEQYDCESELGRLEQSMLSSC